ncbi:glycosyltransferase family 1 protein [Devosia ginsengisoli]|uniref:glycosyltransferase family 4 protein n=1 Tax=Devosia ginsengisoli TaxID=400770 RepID=UPI0026E97605|nr:glycosyltransferase family 1 protein [Devosia ginsengisoli]MCR6673799.1 glycosyltransferase family 1 protein [Devosia ginsengisoli]
MPHSFIGIPSRRILIVTDAWRPQINGVVRTLESIARELAEAGHDIAFLTPERFWTLPVPSYPEVRISLASLGAVSRQIEAAAPDHIHIATEGPLGLLARQYCLNHRLGFTTSFHTRFPEYVAMRVPVPQEWSYGYLRWFHAAAARTMVPTPSLHDDLLARGFDRLMLWSRGVDGTRFRPGPKTLFADLPGPHLLYVGRVAAEKNVEAFLDLDIAGTRIVVGDGPDRARLQKAYPDAVFLGYRHGEELGELYRSADVLVFPSHTDTFGNVITEALASGTPVAAFPVTGPRDVLDDPKAGALDENLNIAVARALTLDRTDARAHGERFTWAASAAQFFAGLEPLRAGLQRLAQAG